jgi:hypothetical protein
MSTVRIELFFTCLYIRRKLLLLVKQKLSKLFPKEFQSKLFPKSILEENFCHALFHTISKYKVDFKR